MPYQANKPQAPDYMSVSQADLQNNFLSIKALIDVNHETFGSAYEGKHTVVSFPEQVTSVVPPVFPPATAATELAMYAKADAGATHLFLRPTGQAAGIDVNDLNLTKALLTVTGWCRLPCGIIMKWGTSAAVHGTGGGKTIQLAIAPAPVINTILTVMLTPTDSDNQSIVTYSGFDVANQRVTWTYGRSFAPGGATDAVCKCLVLGF